MTHRIRWTIGMTAFVVVVALAVFLVAESVGWAIVGLFASGMAANAALAPRNVRADHGIEAGRLTATE